MRPFETLATVTTPEGRRLTLHRRDRDYFIHLDGEELMSSRRSGSEVALAERALAALPPVAAPRVLIGGLGLGYTLRAALAVLPGSAEVTVAELFPAVVGWNRSELSALGRPLDDPRVRLLERDVTAVLAEPPAGGWHAVLLDIDNGPSEWCLESNAGLYGRRGIERLRAALAPGGVLGVWSAYRDAGFLRRLGRAGFEARLETARAHGGRGARSFLFLARRGGYLQPS